MKIIWRIFKINKRLRKVPAERQKISVTNIRVQRTLSRRMMI